MHDIGRRLAAGAWTGTGATLAMSAFMLAAQWRGLMTRQPPDEIAGRTVRRLGRRDVDDKALDVISAGLHIGVGAMWGAGYAALLGRARLGALPGIGVGVAYGTAIWLAAYWLSLPRFGLMPKPSSDERLRQEVTLAAHWIYGAVLGLLLGRR